MRWAAGRSSAERPSTAEGRLPVTLTKSDVTDLLDAIRWGRHRCDPQGCRACAPSADRYRGDRGDRRPTVTSVPRAGRTGGTATGNGCWPQRPVTSIEDPQAAAGQLPAVDSRAAPKDRPGLVRGSDGGLRVISDHHLGLTKAINAVMIGAAWQRCRVHFMRNVLARAARAVGHHDRRPLRHRGGGAGGDRRGMGV